MATRTFPHVRSALRLININLFPDSFETVYNQFSPQQKRFYDTLFDLCINYFIRREN